MGAAGFGPTGYVAVIAPSRPSQLLASLFLATGVFAIVGAAFGWGAGPLWQQADAPEQWLQWTDLIVTGPLCLATAWAVWRRPPWMLAVGHMTCGVLLYGSVAVYVQLAVSGPPYPLTWALPPIGGLALTAALLSWLAGQRDAPGSAS